MKLTLLGWAVWLGGLAAMFAADYSIRISQDNLYWGGIPEAVQFSLAAALGLAAVWVLFRGAASLKPWLRVVVVAAQAAAGFCAYAFMALLYVCSAGIDCLKFVENLAFAPICAGSVRARRVAVGSTRSRL